jgi:hypothetical protein
LLSALKENQAAPLNNKENQDSLTNFVRTKKKPSRKAWFSLFTFDRKAWFFYSLLNSPKSRILAVKRLF